MWLCNDPCTVIECQGSQTATISPIDKNAFNYMTTGHFCNVMRFFSGFVRKDKLILAANSPAKLPFPLQAP
jgi:hypothetical protein